MKKIFIDTNVLIDIITGRDGYMHSAQVLALSDKTDVSLHVSVLTMANIAYILRKQFRGEAMRKYLATIANRLFVDSLTDSQFQSSLSFESPDFEDSLQYFCAIENECSVIITNNVRHFKFSSIPVMTPSEFINSTKHPA